MNAPPGWRWRNRPGAASSNASPGFVRKQLWIDVDDPGCVHAMIEWESMDSWKAIPHHELEAVDASMGPWFRDCTCRTFEVLRNC